MNHNEKKSNTKTTKLTLAIILGKVIMIITATMIKIRMKRIILIILIDIKSKS